MTTNVRERSDRGAPIAVAAWRSRIVGEGQEAPDQLLANPANWRVHPKAQQDALGSVLDRVGWVQRCIVNRTTGHVVDGHLRVALAISRGEPSVPVLYVELSAEEEALVLASLDPLAAMASTDEEKLRALLAEVTIGSEALAAMLAELAPPPRSDGLVDPDEIPEPPDDAVTQPGDLWTLGEHRLLCGDAGSVADLDRLLDGVVADLLLRATSTFWWCVTPDLPRATSKPLWWRPAASERLDALAVPDRRGVGDGLGVGRPTRPTTCASSRAATTRSRQACRASSTPPREGAGDPPQAAPRGPAARGRLRH